MTGLQQVFKEFKKRKWYENMVKNIGLNNAIINRDDEFYTRYEDIEKELSHYFEYLSGKTVYCNCDDPHLSNFPRYFIRNFHKIGLCRLICTGYSKFSVGSFLDVCAEEIPLNSDSFSDADLNALIDSKTGNLTGNGDYTSYECISYLKESDVVVTNPPFSKFREYFGFLARFDVDLLLITFLLSLSYNVVLPYISTGQLKVSNVCNVQSMSFVRPPEQTLKKFGNVRWITTFNIPIFKQITTVCQYNKGNYRFYDGFPNIININHLSEIPDYDGVMGVPVSYLDYHNPQLFEIIDFAQHDLYIDGKKCFRKILIRRRHGAGDDGAESQSSQNGSINWEDYQIKDLNTDVQTNLSNWV